MSVDDAVSAGRDAMSLRDLARAPELRALLIEHAGRGFRVQAIVRGLLAIFIALTVLLEPPAGTNGAALVIAAVYCVWAIAVYVAVRVNDERVLRLNWVALSGDVIALGLVTLTAAVADKVSWTGDILLNGFFLIPVLAAVQLRVWVAVAAVLPTLGVFLVCSAIARQVESQPWSYVLLRVLALVGMSVGCVLLVRVQGSRVLAIGNMAAHRTALLAELLETETRERAQLTEELHDGALQYVLAARHDVDDLPPNVDAGLRTRLVDALTEASGMLRSQVSRLTPAILDQAGLAAAVQLLAADASERGHFISEVDVTGWPDEPTNVDRLLFDSARELLINVIKHANAQSVQTTLSHSGGIATLVVTDDGTGIDQTRARDQLRAGHVGLATRRIRAEAAGGTLQAIMAAGGGTAVTVAVPVRPAYTHVEAS